MTRNATIGAGVIAIIVVGAIIYALSSGDSAMMQKDEVMMEDSSAAGGTMLEGSAMPENGMVGGDAMVEDDTMMKEEDAMKKGSYETYSPEKLALAAQGDVLLFFHAPWCPICKAIESEITGNSAAIPAGVTILKVDFDSATELRKKYGVTVQHTFVHVRTDGSAIAKWSDSTSLAGVLRKVQ